MNAEQLPQAAKELKEELAAVRWYLHSIPGIGFDLKDTLAFR